MLPTARDYHPLANARYRAPVPAELMAYLVAHREDLVPELRERWATFGYRNAGTWAEVFGPGLPTEDIFMAWYFARYTEAVVAASNDEWEMAGAVIVQTGANEFYIAGSGVVATFAHRTQPKLNVGILKVDEGEFRAGEWTVVRHLNGDQTHQGRHVRIFKDDFAIQRVELYTYE